MSGGFWRSDRAWEAIEPVLSKSQPGARRVDDRRVISGIIHVLPAGCRWQDCPPEYGPSTIPSTRSRKTPLPCDDEAYGGRNLIKRAFCRLKDRRHTATRYGKLAISFASAVAIAATVIWSCD